jgi:uncharacterized protein YjbJ (UPF0337 family)
MDENTITGTAKNIGGKAQEGFGRLTGDAKDQAEGVARQVTGAAQEIYGQVRDGAKDAAGAARDNASSVERAIRTTIENQPYTAVGIALGLGWLFGRIHRPL